MSLVAWFKGRGPNGFGYASTAEEVTEGVDLSGKTILITGVSSGLGAESARVLAKRGATILGTARSREKAQAACADLPGAVPLVCELSDPASIRACVDEVKALGVTLDVILANAGVMALQQRELVHGLEKQFFVNHIGHFVLVTGLLDVLADDGRVVILSSAAHAQAPEGGIRFDDLALERSYHPWTAYGQSKLANLLFARELSKRFEGTDKIAIALHPGVIATNLGRHMPLPLRVLFPIASVIAMKSVPQGAATQCYAAAHPDAVQHDGEYLADCNPAKCTRYGRDPALAERLWRETEAIIAAL